jgi:hypothetical protein
VLSWHLESNQSDHESSGQLASIRPCSAVVRNRAQARSQRMMNDDEEPIWAATLLSSHLELGRSKSQHNRPRFDRFRNNRHHNDRVNRENKANRR